MADGEIVYVPAACRVCGGFAWRDMRESGKPPICRTCKDAGRTETPTTEESVEPSVEAPESERPLMEGLRPRLTPAETEAFYAGRPISEVTPDPLPTVQQSLF